jgi:hypothetical protein
MDKQIFLSKNGFERQHPAAISIEPSNLEKLHRKTWGFEGNYCFLMKISLDMLTVIHIIE